MNDRYYFAYGSNMDQAQMSERCPGAVALGIAELRDYRFIVNTLGEASVVPESGSSVYGILWKITKADEGELDEYEDVEIGTYMKMRLCVVITTGEKVCALGYIARHDRPGSPKYDYMDRIIAAAERYGFPSTYITQLKSWL